MLRLAAVRGLALSRGLPLASARSIAVPGAAAAQQQRPQQLQPCRAAGSGGGGGRQIAPPDVRELARLAHIEVTDEEVADWGPKIESIVEWFGQLQEVDVEGVPPALQADLSEAEGASALRPDQARRYPGAAAMLDQAAGREGAFVRVPKIATAADE